MTVWIMLAFIPLSWVALAVMVQLKTAYDNTGNRWCQLGAGILGLGMPIATVYVFNILPY